MPDEEQENLVTFDELKERNLNKILPSDVSVKLSAENYERGLRITNDGMIAEDFGHKGRTTIELTDSEGNDINLSQGKVNFALDMFPAGSDYAFKISNPHPQESMQVWVYGKRETIPPGGEFNVPTKKPKEYESIEGIPDGVFYVEVGESAAVRVERKPLSNEVSVKNCTLKKEVITKEEPEENIDNKEYTKEDYDEAKKTIREEIEKHKDEIAAKIPEYEETLAASRKKFDKGVPDIIIRLEAEVARYRDENEAALKWLENPTDEPDTRGMVADFIKRRAEELLHYVVMTQNVQEVTQIKNNPHEWEDLEKYYRKMLRASRVLREYDTSKK